MPITRPVCANANGTPRMPAPTMVFTRVLMEAERLAARPPPAASQPATGGQGGVDGESGAGGSGGERNRPRGAAPKGKVWCEGAWVDARRARKAPSPGTDLTLKVRPIGRLPKGKRWDPVGGCLVSAGGGRFKRKAAVEAPRDENAAPQRQRRSQRV